MAAPNGERTQEERPFESWKEISRYLHCSLRTCQRWEKELDLPIHRLDGTPKARVFAYKPELDRWLKTKLKYAQDPGEEASPARKSAKKWLAGASAGFLLLGAGGYLALRRQILPLPPVPDEKPTVAILPFENASGDKALDGWTTALPDLVITDMAQSRVVNVVRITDLHRTLTGLERGQAGRFSGDDLMWIAEKTGADRVATGSIQKAGRRGLVLDVSVRDPKSGEAPRPIRAAFQTGRGVFAAADELTKGIKRALDLDKRDLSRDVDRDVRRVSTASPEAFILFSRGFRLAGIEKYQDGIVLLQQAVEIDPKFALAFKYLWRASSNAGRSADGESYMRQAAALCGRLSEKERGDLTVLFYRDHEKDPAKERAALERLWRFHPDDRFGGIQLMHFYVEREDWSKALNAAERGLAANKQEIIFILGVVQCYQNLGLGEKALKILDEFIGANPGHLNWPEAVRVRAKCRLLDDRFDDALADLEARKARYPGMENSIACMKSVVRIYRGDLAGAESELEGLLGRDDILEKLEALMLLCDIRLMQGKIVEAEALLRRGAEAAAVAGDGDRRFRATTTALRYELAYLHWITGDLAGAMKEVEAVEEALRPGPGEEGNPPNRLEALKLKGFLLLKMERMEEFARAAGEAREIAAAQPNPKLMRAYYHLLGHAEMRKGEPREAAEYFWKALDATSLPGPDLDGADPWIFYDLADAIERSAGHPNYRALPVYEKILSPLVNRLHHGDMYARSLYRVARIHEHMCRNASAAEDIRTGRAKAVEHYRKFLELWKDADPIFAPEVKDARERLAALESETGLPRNTDRPTK